MANPKASATAPNYVARHRSLRDTSASAFGDAHSFCELPPLLCEQAALTSICHA
jgi:hypothetical protein